MKNTFGACVNRGPGAGFDVLRFVAASGVLVSHAFPLTGLDEPLGRITGGIWDTGAVCVGIFFCASGFLIAMSADRTRSKARFVERRAMRLMPALVTVVIMTVFLLGPLLTTLPLINYFLNSETLRYLGLAAFLPSNGHLPGVFQDNIYPQAVNGSLWTLRYEAVCYGIIFMIQYFLPYKRMMYVAVMLLFFMLEIYLKPGTLSPYHLFSFFMVGSIFYIFRDKIPCNWKMMIASVIVLICIMPFSSLAIFSAFPICYMTLFAGYADIKLPFLSENDLSYGIYLYAFPVQQTVSSLFSTNYIGNILISWPVTILFAWVSWNMIERNAKSLKIFDTTLVLYLRKQVSNIPVRLGH